MINLAPYKYITPVKHTVNGTPYLTGPSVAAQAIVQWDPQGVRPFIESFGDLYDADDYCNDEPYPDDATGLIKTAGQLCYLSFGKARTRNADAQQYMDKSIKAQFHGSVLEHANITFLFWGIDRAVTHELVRHRAGFAYSQVSQRYVDGKALRFVERPEYQNDPLLHESFEKWIDKAVDEYDRRAELLSRTLDLSGKTKTEARKAVNQAARACLPNETEAPIFVTANGRAWRHCIEMRASRFADTTIRELMFRTGLILQQLAACVFNDYQLDGTNAFKTEFRKV